MSSDADKLASEVTNEIMRDKFATEIGQKAVVERRVLEQTPHTAQLREVLSDVAKNMQEVGLVSRGLDYKGSFSVHVFVSEALRCAEFAPLTTPHAMDAGLADAALKNLKDSVMADYGQRIQKRRSGF